jgi:hypothetical protein
MVSIPVSIPMPPLQHIKQIASKYSKYVEEFTAVHKKVVQNKKKVFLKAVRESTGASQHCLHLFGCDARPMYVLLWRRRVLMMR